MCGKRPAPSADWGKMVSSIACAMVIPYEWGSRLSLSTPDDAGRRRIAGDDGRPLIECISPFSVPFLAHFHP